MALVQEVVNVPQSMQTVVKSVVDVVMAIKGGGDLGVLLTDLSADVMAIPTLVPEAKAYPFEALSCGLLGVVKIIKAVVLPVPVTVEPKCPDEVAGVAV